MMKLWLLRPVEELEEESGHVTINAPRIASAINNPWRPWYDKSFGFVVRAETEDKARAIASSEGGDEVRKNELAWIDPQYSTCEELTAEGEAEVVICEFHAA